MKKHKICMARIFKNISYFILPLAFFALIATFVVSVIFDENPKLKSSTNYTQTDQFYNYYHELIEYNYSLKVDTEPKKIFYESNEDSNFIYLIVNNKTNEIRTNVKNTQETNSLKKIKEYFGKCTIYWNYVDGKTQTNIASLEKEASSLTSTSENKKDEKIDIYTALLNDLPYEDEFNYLEKIYQIIMKVKSILSVILTISIVSIIVLVIIIINGIGKTAKKDGINLNSFDNLKIETVILITGIILTIGILFLGAVESEWKTVVISGVAIGSVIIYSAFILFLETLVKRIKTHTLWKTTFLYAIVQTTEDMVTNRGEVARLIVWYSLIYAISLIGIIGILSSDTPEGKFFWWLILIAISIFSFYHSYSELKEFHKIQNALQSIYDGNTSITLNTEEMDGSFKQLAMYIQKIAGGLSNAMEESLKSERLKTELITNVSHDIKTPLTSIINYVDLLKKEKMPNEQCEEYLKILDQKSQRLKKLSEDLVEASKAASGSISLKMEKINVIELVNQVSGEWKDKFQQKNMQEVLTLPKENIYIKADGKHMYRILENIYGNAAKYALEGTRVYIDVISKQQSVVIEMKNISREKLNIDAEELMQRFVRGETARNTEGSGLGLSIASSLTKLQGGKFNIYLDGDLFKVTLVFEQVL